MKMDFICRNISEDFVCCFLYTKVYSNPLRNGQKVLLNFAGSDVTTYGMTACIPPSVLIFPSDFV